MWRRFAAHGDEGCSRAWRTGLTMGPEHAAAGFGAITPIFGFGQIIGPAVAGAAADATGSFSSSFAMAAALAALAIVPTLFLRKPA